MVDGRDQILRTDRAVNREGSVAVGAAMNDAGPYSGAGEDHGVAAAPMASPAFTFDQRSSAELAHPHDKCFIEQSAYVEVVEQGGETHIELRGQDWQIL